MPDRFLIKVAAPMTALSLLLLGVGAAAAWTVHRQQIVTSNLIAREVEGMLAAHDFYIGMRDVRHTIKYAKSRDEDYQQAISRLRQTTGERLKTAEALARTEHQKSLIATIDTVYRGFWEEFDRINRPDFSGDHEAALLKLATQQATTEIRESGEQYIDANREFVERTNEASQVTSMQLGWSFLLLGVCGGAGGLIGGVAITRAISRSIVQLEVSVRSAEGKLHPVAGPVRISRYSGFRELETSLGRIESQISDLVERLQRSETEVLRNEQLAAVGQLAAGIAHEFRNPLMPIKMLVQAALERGDARGLSGRQLEVVEEEIERLERSIDVFLEFARPVSPEKCEFDVVGVIDQALELVTARAAKQAVGFRRRLPEAPVPVVADIGQIRQVLLNLLLNALDAMPEGGEASVAVRRLASDEAPNLVPFVPWCEIRIGDSGPGLSEKVLANAFEPFVTTKETGTGLGLSICRRIISAHGGEISARNLPHGGAEFRVRLPCISVAAVPEPASDALIKIA
jgi:two-component system, NtrC family, sensor histidine kinase HydH